MPTPSRGLHSYVLLLMMSPPLRGDSPESQAVLRTEVTPCLSSNPVCGDRAPAAGLAIRAVTTFLKSALAEEPS